MDPLSVLSLIVGIIGTATAVYQTAVINENKKTKGELQFLLAGINSSAILKMMKKHKETVVLNNEIQDNVPKTTSKEDVGS